MGIAIPVNDKKMISIAEYCVLHFAPLLRSVNYMDSYVLVFLVGQPYTAIVFYISLLELSIITS